MRLSASGNAVTGTYESNSGKLTGTVSGNRLSGTQSESPSYKPLEGAGDFQCTMASGGGSVTGQWRYGSSGSWSTWNGTCIGSG